ncbi:MAG TPA: hypothetical protein HPP81_04700 [Deltaproteobacteria bacterium]|nr:hypothetical protein [Deltaproteobacteria bacterium]
MAARALIQTRIDRLQLGLAGDVKAAGKGNCGSTAGRLIECISRAAAELYVRLQIMVILNMAPLHQVMSNGVGLNAAAGS